MRLTPTYFLFYRLFLCHRLFGLHPSFLSIPIRTHPRLLRVAANLTLTLLLAHIRGGFAFIQLPDDWGRMCQFYPRNSTRSKLQLTSRNSEVRSRVRAARGLCFGGSARPGDRSSNFTSGEPRSCVPCCGRGRYRGRYGAGFSVIPFHRTQSWRRGTRGRCGGWTQSRPIGVGDSDPRHGGMIFVCGLRIPFQSDWESFAECFFRIFNRLHIKQWSMFGRARFS